MGQATALDGLQPISHNSKPTCSLQSVQNVIGAIYQIGTDRQLLHIGRAHLARRTGQLNGFQQQLKPTHLQDGWRDFPLFQSLPELLVDPAIDVQILIFEGRVD